MVKRLGDDAAEVRYLVITPCGGQFPSYHPPARLTTLPRRAKMLTPTLVRTLTPTLNPTLNPNITLA